MKFLFTVFLTLFIFSFQSQCQEAITGTSGTISGNGGSIDYSVGLIVHKELEGPDGSISQGVQVSKEVLTHVEEIHFSSLISVYPNPVSDKLTLNFSKYYSAKISCSIMSITGETLKEETFDFTNNTINLESLSAGIYFLRLKSAAHISHTIKIIKN